MDRKALLDLGTRNRLINIPLRTKNIRAIEIIDEKSSEVFRLLGESKRFTFLAAKAEASANPKLPLDVTVISYSPRRSGIGSSAL
jgi:hypothetical protein